MRAFLALIVLSALLAACGYKGPLYLPPPEPPPQPEAAPKKPAPENDKEKAPSP